MFISYDIYETRRVFISYDIYETRRVFYIPRQRNTQLVS